MLVAFSLLLGLVLGEEILCMVSKDEFTWDFSQWKLATSILEPAFRSRFTNFVVPLCSSSNNILASQSSEFLSGEQLLRCLELVCENCENGSQFVCNGETVSIFTGDYNYPPMHGMFTYEVDFCNDVLLKSKETGFGWDYGELVRFSPNTHYIPPLNTSYHIAFELEYAFGDAGPPCVDQYRSAITELFCDEKLDCSRFPGSNGRAECLSGDPKTGFCVCSVNFTQPDPHISPLCEGMVIYLLSHNCPDGTLTPINPTPGPAPGNVAGTVFLVIFLLIVAVFIAGVFYNYFVHGARGVETLPLYATCCGGSASRTQYADGQDTGVTRAGGSYGSL